MVRTKLNAKQQVFIREYLVDKNGKRAAIRAGYSAKTAESMASRLLRNAKVQAELQTALDEQLERVEVRADEVLRELLRLAMIDTSRAYDAEGRLLHPKDMPEDVRRAVSSFQVEALLAGRGTEIGTTTKVKFWDKPRALELLAKHLGLLKERMEVTGKDGGPIQTESKQRLNLKELTDGELQQLRALIGRARAPEP